MSCSGNIPGNMIQLQISARYLPDINRSSPQQDRASGRRTVSGLDFPRAIRIKKKRDPGVKPTWRILEGELEEPSNFEDSKILNVPRKQTTFTCPACEFYVFTPKRGTKNWEICTCQASLPGDHGSTWP